MTRTRVRLESPIFVTCGLDSTWQCRNQVIFFLKSSQATGQIFFKSSQVSSQISSNLFSSQVKSQVKFSQVKSSLKSNFLKSSHVASRLSSPIKVDFQACVCKARARREPRVRFRRDCFWIFGQPSGRL